MGREIDMDIIILYLFMGAILTWVLDRIGNIKLARGAPWTEWAVAITNLLGWPILLQYHLGFSLPHVTKRHRRAATIMWLGFILLFSLAVCL